MPVRAAVGLSAFDLDARNEKPGREARFLFCRDRGDLSRKRRA
ncbi:hypothetical protein GLE_1013 [Lysobacter enzymogenes]|uniref:Uncharacterized protein n=1 Tax=Lysobacter enzymogenes TaxID=69 RepID=A0A0S2DCU9_LYSEN|nr:hypothetical protein GLE_1013 [Lysobacter enzymogenes]